LGIEALASTSLEIEDLARAGLGQAVLEIEGLDRAVGPTDADIKSILPIKIPRLQAGVLLWATLNPNKK